MYVVVLASLVFAGTVHSVMTMIFATTVTWQTSTILHMLLFALTPQRHSGNQHLHALCVILITTIFIISSFRAIGWMLQQTARVLPSEPG